MIQPRSTPDTIDSAGLCALFGVGRSTLHARRAQWEAQGFPLPLPWRGLRILWRKSAVERWRTAMEARAGCNGATPLLLKSFDGGRAA